MKSNTNINKHNFKIGDKVTFTNKLNTTFDMTVVRIEEKSIYTTFFPLTDTKGRREAYSTLNDLVDNHNAIITRI